MGDFYRETFVKTSVPSAEVRALCDAEPGAGPYSDGAYMWAAGILDRLAAAGWHLVYRCCGVACPIGVIAAPCSLAEGHAGRHQTGLMAESQSSPKYRIEWDNV